MGNLAPSKLAEFNNCNRAPRKSSMNLSSSQSGVVEKILIRSLLGVQKIKVCNISVLFSG